MDRYEAYNILDIPPDATPQEKKAAYRERVKQFHPDGGGDNESFALLQEAYRVAMEHGPVREEDESVSLSRKIASLVLVMLMLLSVFYFSLLVW
jgi:curved DNA-binding protein CbpA